MPLRMTAYAAARVQEKNKMEYKEIKVKDEAQGRK